MDAADLLEGTAYKFKKLFKKGKQGVTGLLESRSGELVVFKISQHIDYLTYHERTVAERLNDLQSPMFMRLINSDFMKVNPSSSAEHPFVGCNHPVTKLVLFFEYIEGYSLSKVIRKKHYIPVETLLSSIKMVLVSLYIAQKTVKFTHYDLHTSNVMLKKCDRNKVCVFTLDEENRFVIPTYGYIPVIIDYGFAYVDKIDSGPMYQSLAHTNVGFISCAFDPFADGKLFLASCTSQLQRYRRCKQTVRLRNLFKKVFKPLDFDRDCGWDKNDDDAIGNEVLVELHKANKKCISDLFYKYDAFAVDIMTSLVRLPITTGPVESADGLVLYHKKFLRQFGKLENAILSSYGRLRALKLIVDSARRVMPQFYSRQGKDDAVCMFEMYIIQGIDSIAKHANISSINYEKMLCSLALFARALDGYMQEKLAVLLDRKKAEYSLLKVKNIIEIYGAIELKIPPSDDCGDDRSSSSTVFWHIKPFKPPEHEVHSSSSEFLKRIDRVHALEKGYCFDQKRRLRREGVSPSASSASSASSVSPTSSTP